MKMMEVGKKTGIYEGNDGNDIIVDGKKLPYHDPRCELDKGQELPIRA